MVPQAMETPRQGQPEALAPASTCTRMGASASQRLQDHTTHFDMVTLYSSHRVHPCKFSNQ